MQQWLIRTYHGVIKGQLQAYLDQFVFRRNRSAKCRFPDPPWPWNQLQINEVPEIRRTRDLDLNTLGLAEATRYSEDSLKFSLAMRLEGEYALDPANGGLIQAASFCHRPR